MASGNALLGLRGDVPEVWERDPSDAERVYRKIVGWPGTVSWCWTSL